MKKYAAFAVAILALATAMRLSLLTLRPMHGDEANQAVRTGMLLEQGTYKYDPTDHHGPTLYYAALPFCKLAGDTLAETDERTFRLVPAVFSLLTILLVLFAWRDRRGLIAAGLLAVSPSLSYFARFFIQEGLLVFFLLAAYLLGRCWGRAPTPRVRLLSAFGCGASLGLCMATKETWVLSAAAAVCAVVVAGWRGGMRPSARQIALGLIFATLGALVVALAFFTGFFTQGGDVLQTLGATISAYAKKSVSSIHVHPWFSYLSWVGWFRYGRGPIFGEALLVPLALVSIVRSFSRRVPEGIFIAVYTLVLTLLYSAIPYKTPWCALGFVIGWIWLAADGVDICLQDGRRIVAWGAALALVALLGWHAHQAINANFRYPADVRNPYVYAHTSSDCLKLVEKIRSLAREKGALRIAVVSASNDVWPLPWYLRAQRQVGYWSTVESIPANWKPQILVVESAQGDAAAHLMGADQEVGFYGLRPGVLVSLFACSER